jgi:hypothetical protein
MLVDHVFFLSIFLQIIYSYIFRVSETEISKSNTIGYWIKID